MYTCVYRCFSDRLAATRVVVLGASASRRETVIKLFPREDRLVGIAIDDETGREFFQRASWSKRSRANGLRELVPRLAKPLICFVGAERRSPRDRSALIVSAESVRFAPRFHLPSARQARKSSAREISSSSALGSAVHLLPIISLPPRDSRSGRNAVSSSSYIPAMYVPRAARGVASFKVTLQRSCRPRYVHYTRVPNV